MKEKDYNTDFNRTYICCVFFIMFLNVSEVWRAHLLLGNPRHGIIKDPLPLKGAHAASVPPCGHPTD